MTPQSGVRSPCINLCEIDAGTGWCRGCHRTLREIAHWTSLSDAEKRGILAQLEERAWSGPGAPPR